MSMPTSCTPSPARRRAIAAVIASALLAAAPLPAQPTRPAPSCDCAEILAGTVERIEANYVAFPLEVRGVRAIAWRAHVDSLRPLATGADAGACSALLRRLVRFFRDGHLLIIDRPVADSAGLPARRAARPTRAMSASDPWNERAVLDSLRARRVRGVALAPVEGLWRGPGYRIAVLADGDARDRATGVVVAVDSGPWCRDSCAPSSSASMASGSRRCGTTASYRGHRRWSSRAARSSAWRRCSGAAWILPRRWRSSTRSTRGDRWSPSRTTRRRSSPS
jgi:hypothetical protein